MRRLLPNARTTAKSTPSGDQSAHETRSRTSRGAPPANGTRAMFPPRPSAADVRERRESECQILRGVKPVFALLLEAVRDDGRQRRRKARIGVREFRRIFFEDGVQSLGRRVTFECPLSREHLVQNDA